jgi:hypothetical protein
MGAAGSKPMKWKGHRLLPDVQSCLVPKLLDGFYLVGSSDAADD